MQIRAEHEGGLIAPPARRRQRARRGPWRGLLFLLPLLAAACGGGTVAEGPASAPVVAPGTWVVLGSSSAAGVGASPGQGWVAKLAAANAARGVTVHNLARSGALSYQALPSASTPPAERPAPDSGINTDRALGLAPRLLLLSFPSNDVVAGYSAEETTTNLLAMRSQAMAAGAATVVLGSQPRGGLNVAQRAVQDDVDARLSSRLGDCFVSLQAVLADAAGQIAPGYAAEDGVHLNDAGHTVVRQRVQAALDSGRCVRLAGG